MVPNLYEKKEFSLESSTNIFSVLTNGALQIKSGERNMLILSPRQDKIRLNYAMYSAMNSWFSTFAYAKGNFYAHIIIDHEQKSQATASSTSSKGPLKLVWANLNDIPPGVEIVYISMSKRWRDNTNSRHGEKLLLKSSFPSTMQCNAL